MTRPSRATLWRWHVDKLIGGSIAIGLIVIALGFMFLAWRARQRRATVYGRWPEFDSTPSESFDVFYVATTLGESSLERVALTGFTYRGFASLEVFDAGIQIRLSTGDVLTLPKDALIRYEFSRVAVDKVVEKDGLIALTWQSAPKADSTTVLTTFVRLKDHAVRDHLTNVLAKLVSVTTTEELS
jgi:hypothetical protein